MEARVFPDCFLKLLTKNVAAWTDFVLGHRLEAAFAFHGYDLLYYHGDVLVFHGRDFLNPEVLAFRAPPSSIHHHLFVIRLEEAQPFRIHLSRAD